MRGARELEVGCVVAFYFSSTPSTTGHVLRLLNPRPARRARTPLPVLQLRLIARDARPPHSSEHNGVSDERSAESRVLPLIGLIYDAFLQPSRWSVFLSALAAELGEPAIVLNIELPNLPASQKTYRTHSDDHFGKVFAELAMSGEVPWPLAKLAEYDRFVRSDEFLSEEELGKTKFYREYMKPQGLICAGQVGHVMSAIGERPLAALGIYRREGGRAIEEPDIVMLDLLVPHLRRGYAIYTELRDTRHRRDIIAEAVDRFSMGVLFIDRDLQVVDSNRAGERIAMQNDGLAIIDGVPQATEPSSAIGFASLIEQAVTRGLGSSIAGSIFSIDRPSGRRPYEVHVSTLLSASATGQPRQAVAAVFIADAQDQQLRMPDVLATLYNLTHAEADLASLLCAGKSIDEAATAREITRNTARAQLKAVFSKTGVKRQTDLVRLLTASVAALENPSSDEPPKD